MLQFIDSRAGPGDRDYEHNDAQGLSNMTFVAGGQRGYYDRSEDGVQGVCMADIYDLARVRNVLGVVAMIT
jgi:hypothetical protein